MNQKNGHVSPQFHLVFDKKFETSPHLRAGTVPDNWADLITNSREKSTEGFYDLTKTWFDGEVEITADSPATSIPSNAMQKSSADQQRVAAWQPWVAAWQLMCSTWQPIGLM